MSKKEFLEKIRSNAKHIILIVVVTIIFTVWSTNHNYTEMTITNMPNGDIKITENKSTNAHHDTKLVKLSNPDEWRAYEEIEDKLHFHPMSLKLFPIGTTFDDYEVNIKKRSASIYYNINPDKYMKYSMYLSNPCIGDTNEFFPITNHDWFIVLTQKDNYSMATWVSDEIYYVVQSNLVEKELLEIIRELR